MNDMHLIGLQVDQYQIKQHIARGGMADVYLADDVTLGRQVALKIMLRDLSGDPAFTARFQREAQTVARLSHPNIIQIYTTGETPDGRPYLAMPFLRNGSLQDQLEALAAENQRMTVRDALRLAHAVAGALVVSHAAGVIHRDLKPNNILISDRGDPVLTDLGIAALSTVETRLTRTGSIMGTPTYMSPEQAKGQPVDGRTDIYALGIILYEMLAGNVPFDAASPLAVLHQHVSEEPPPLAGKRSGLKGETYETVEKCLAKEPANRFQNAEALVVALEQAMMAEGIITPHGSAAYSPPSQGGNARWMLALVAVPVVLLLATAAWYLQRDPAVATVEATRAPTQQATGNLVTDVPGGGPIASPEVLETSTVVVPTPEPTALPTPITGDDGNVYFGNALLIEAAPLGCSGTKAITYAPNGGYFAVVLACFEDDNHAFIFNADGSGQQALTAEWDYLNGDQFTWTDDGYFVYRRINSCCVSVVPPDAPPEGDVWYSVADGQKLMLDMPSPLEPQQVINVAADDRLTMHAEGGTASEIVGEIPYDADTVEVAGRGIEAEGQLWVPVRYGDQSGWVNSSYLISTAAPPPLDVTALNTMNVVAERAARPPVIDGVLDDWSTRYAYQSMHQVHSDETWDGTVDLSAQWLLSWDDAFLYVGLIVDDDLHVQTETGSQTYRGDSAEIQFDTDRAGDFGPTLSDDDLQVNLSPGDFAGIQPSAVRARGGGVTTSNNVRIAARPTGVAAGYTLEAAIPWSDLSLTPQSDLVIGLALNVTDNDQIGKAVQEVLISNAPRRAYADPSTWGTLTLQ